MKEPAIDLPLAFMIWLMVSVKMSHHQKVNPNMLALENDPIGSVISNKPTVFFIYIFLGTQVIKLIIN